jgi:hypothetical protein
VVKKTNTLHHTRLMPRRNRETGRLETSVCRSQSLSEAQVWQICTAYFDVHAPKPAIGRGVGPSEAVFKVNLYFDADGKPYPEHATLSVGVTPQILLITNGSTFGWTNPKGWRLAFPTCRASSLIDFRIMTLH